MKNHVLLGEGVILVIFLMEFQGKFYIEPKALTTTPALTPSPRTPPLPTSASPQLSLAAAEVRLYTFFTQLAAPSITSLAQPQVAFTALILTAKGFSRFTATRPQTEGGGLCSREDKTAPKTSTWAGVSTKWALETWPASSGWDLTRSIAWRPADRASYEWRWETGAEAGPMPNMDVSVLVMSSRCTGWVWARIQARRETRWRGTTRGISSPRTGIMIRVVGTVLCATKAPGGTAGVMTPTWTGSTWGTRRMTRESTGIPTKKTASPWNLWRWSCAQQTNLPDSGFPQVGMTQLTQNTWVFQCPLKNYSAIIVFIYYLINMILMDMMILSILINIIIIIIIVIVIVVIIIIIIIINIIIMITIIIILLLSLLLLLALLLLSSSSILLVVLLEIVHVLLDGVNVWAPPATRTNIWLPLEEVLN